MLVTLAIGCRCLKNQRSDMECTNPRCSYSACDSCGICQHCGNSYWKKEKKELEKNMVMSDEDCKLLIEEMTSKGWILDTNNETRIGFINPDGEKEWFRDYYKDTGKFIHGEW